MGRGNSSVYHWQYGAFFVWSHKMCHLIPESSRRRLGSKCKMWTECPLLSKDIHIAVGCHHVFNITLWLRETQYKSALNSFQSRRTLAIHTQTIYMQMTCNWTPCLIESVDSNTILASFTASPTEFLYIGNVKDSQLVQSSKEKWEYGKLGHDL